MESSLGVLISPDSMEQIERRVGGADNLGTLIERGADYLRSAHIDRRSFLGASAASIVALLASCISTNVPSYAPGGGNLTIPLIPKPEKRVPEPEKRETVAFPRLPGHKIQVPENYGLEGCYTGVSTSKLIVLDKRTDIKDFADKYSKNPTIYGDAWVTSRNNRRHNWYPKKFIQDIIENGSVPCIFIKPEEIDLVGIIKGKADRIIKRDAKRAEYWGENQGYSLFYRPMIEMNISFFDWGRQSKNFIKAWRHIWNIFENEGANKYLTWVWNPYVESLGGDPIENYYPGDKFVDWVGISGHSRSMHGVPSFKYIFDSTYKKVRKNYPSKPIMVPEFATASGYYRAKWIKETFKVIKEEYKGIKAFIWFNRDVTSFGTKWAENWKIDTSSKSRTAFKEAISDPYYLGGILQNGRSPELAEQNLIDGPIKKLASLDISKRDMIVYIKKCLTFN